MGQKYPKEKRNVFSDFSKCPNKRIIRIYLVLTLTLRGSHASKIRFFGRSLILIFKLAY